MTIVVFSCISAFELKNRVVVCAHRIIGLSQSKGMSVPKAGTVVVQ